MEPPLVVVDGHDIGLFSCADALTLKLEPPDVRDGVYDVFDSRGRAIELGVGNNGVEHVVITSVEAEPEHAQQLRSALIGGLAAGFDEAAAELAERSLGELVALAIERLGLDG